MHKHFFLKPCHKKISLRMYNFLRYIRKFTNNHLPNLELQ
jgi:hypothetical protein